MRINILFHFDITSVFNFDFNQTNSYRFSILLSPLNISTDFPNITKVIFIVERIHVIFKNDLSKFDCFVHNKHCAAYFIHPLILTGRLFLNAIRVSPL